jgi:hypothetical protein
MEQYLIDTNVVSDYLSASFPAAGMDLMDKAIDAGPNILSLHKLNCLRSRYALQNLEQPWHSSLRPFVL